MRKLSLFPIALVFLLLAPGLHGQRGGPKMEIVGSSQPPSEPLSLWYQQPAAEWIEALPIGNGRLGGMVFGSVPNERIQLNEDSLWSGGPQEADNPEAE